MHRSLFNEAPSTQLWWVLSAYGLQPSTPLMACLCCRDPLHPKLYLGPVEVTKQGRNIIAIWAPGKTLQRAILAPYLPAHAGVTLSDLNHSGHSLFPIPLYFFLINPWWSLKYFPSKTSFPLGCWRTWPKTLVTGSSLRKHTVEWLSSCPWAPITGDRWSSDSHWHRWWPNCKNFSGGRECIQTDNVSGVSYIGRK